MTALYKAVGGLLLILLLVSPLVLIVFWPGIGSVNISPINAATAGVFWFAILMNVLAGADIVFASEAKAFERSHTTRIESNTFSTARRAHLPAIARLGRSVKGFHLGFGDVDDDEIQNRPFFDSYLRGREWLVGDRVDLYRKVLSRYIPGFLLACTGLARFILDVPLIPLAG